MSEFFDQYFYDNDHNYSVILEDDGIVAYAYLLHEEEIIGDVWLYNQSPSPTETNFRKMDGPPFLNPANYIRTNYSQTLNPDSSIKLRWQPDEICVLIEIGFDLKVVLEADAKPGWSNMVLLDGPVAKLLTHEKIRQFVK